MNNYAQKLMEIFIEFIDQLYYPGYASGLDPDQFKYEFDQFSSNYSIN